MYKYAFLLPIFALFSSHLFAGTIRGTVTDAANNTPLTGVIVSIKNTSSGSQSDIDGKYEINDLQPGTYQVVFSYVTYNSVTERIVIKSNNDVVVLNMKMRAEQTQLEGVTVKSNKITNTETAVVMEIRKANTIASGISSAQISKTMDRNAADVVKRVPGVTVQDDKFIMVRGLTDRYNTVWLNDATAPSSEIDKKAFSFDIVPSGLIDRIMIYKTPAPDLPGDFAGGMVKIYTTSLKDKNEIKVGFQTSYRQYSTGTTFNYNKQSSTDWLGYDNGMRSLPANTPENVSKTMPGINELTKSFGNLWPVYQVKQRPDLRFNLAASNVIKIKSVKIGNTLGASYSNTLTNYKIARQGWINDTTIGYTYSDLQSENKVNAALLDNLAVSWGNSKIEFKNLYNQTGKSSLVERRNVRDSALLANPDELSYAMGYESIAVYSSQLAGTHSFNNSKTKYNWTLGYTDLFKNQPNLMRIRYTKDPSESDSAYMAPIPAGAPDPINGGGRYYAQLFEKTYSFNHQASHRININDNNSVELSAGNFIEYKSRAFWQRNLGYTLAAGNNPNRSKKYLPINEIFADSNVGEQKKFLLNEGTVVSDKYSAQNTLIASFISANFTVNNNLKVLGGVRYEHNKQSLLGYLNSDTLRPEITTKFWLPSVNVSYNFSEQSLLRAAYGKTLNRPEFREWAPVYFYDFDLRADMYGSLYSNTLTAGTAGDTLKVAQIHNFDLRWEWYPGSGEMIHAGVFYKIFRDPIQRLILPGRDPNSRGFSFTNIEGAYTAGVEIDARKNMSFLDDALHTKIFEALTLVGNLSLTKSNATIDTSKVKQAIPKIQLQGQSPYVVNVGAFYQQDDFGLQGSLLYNVYGSRMYAIGTIDDPSIGERPFNSLDFTLSKTFYKHYTLTVGIQNLLDQTMLRIQDTDRDGKFEKNDKLSVSYKPGRYYSIGVKVAF